MEGKRSACLIEGEGAYQAGEGFYQSSPLTSINRGVPSFYRGKKGHLPLLRVRLPIGWRAGSPPIWGRGKGKNFGTFKRGSRLKRERSLGR